MLFASFLAMATAIWLTSVVDNYRVLSALQSAGMVNRMQEAMNRWQGRLISSEPSSDLCAFVVKSMAGEILRSVVPDTQGPNRISNAIVEQRVLARYKGADGVECTIHDMPGKMIDVINSTKQRAAIVPDGQGVVWLQTVSIPLPSGENRHGIATLSLGMQVLSPWFSIVRNRDVSWSVILLYIIAINFVSVFVLVPLLVKRIKRAELAADAWTRGDLSARIDDPRKDEFGRLCSSFDHMADVLANTIQVKVALAAADERNRLAQDLHDTAKQRAFALGLQLTALRKSAALSDQCANSVESALALITHLQTDLVEVSKRLSAPTIAERGLRAALMDVIDALLAGSGVRWELLLPVTVEYALQESPEIARQILLISIEASANVLKHANASCVTMKLQADEAAGSYVWSIEDDGCGFDLSARSTGMGLSNMRWRAASLPGGSFDIGRRTDRSASGTIVKVRFALSGQNR